MIALWVAESTKILEKSETPLLAEWSPLSSVLISLGLEREGGIKWLKPNYISEIKCCLGIMQKWWRIFSPGMFGVLWPGIQNRHLGRPRRDAIKEMDSLVLESPKLQWRANWERHAICIKTPWATQMLTSAGKNEDPVCCWREYDMVNVLWKTVGRVLKMLIIESPDHAAFHCQSSTQGKWKGVPTKSRVWMFRAA